MKKLFKEIEEDIEFSEMDVIEVIEVKDITQELEPKTIIQYSSLLPQNMMNSHYIQNDPVTPQRILHKSVYGNDKFSKQNFDI